MPQNYSNHRKYYPLHHFILLPLNGLLLGYSVYHAISHPEEGFPAIGLAVSFALILALAVMNRQHYSLLNQDRIIRLEMRVRYFQLTGLRLETLEKQLSFGQIAALRFASDEELPDLAKRTVQESLSANQIKKEIRNWVADEMRV